MPGWHCVNHSLFWGWLTIISSVFILSAYWITAYKQYAIILRLQPGPSRTSLATNTNIFTLCGICSYLFIIIMMWWPVWQIRGILMILLAIAAWRNVLALRNLKAIYGQVEEKAIISDKLISEQEINKEIVEKTQEIKPHISKLSNSVVFKINDQTSIETLKKIEEIRIEIIKLEKLQKELDKIIYRPKTI